MLQYRVWFGALKRRSSLSWRERCLSWFRLAACLLADFDSVRERLALVVEGLNTTSCTFPRPAGELNLHHRRVVDADELAPPFGDGRKHLLDSFFEFRVIP